MNKNFYYLRANLFFSHKIIYNLYKLFVFIYNVRLPVHTGLYLYEQERCCTSRINNPQNSSCQVNQRNPSEFPTYFYEYFKLSRGMKWMWLVSSKITPLSAHLVQLEDKNKIKKVKIKWNEKRNKSTGVVAGRFNPVEVVRDLSLQILMSLFHFLYTIYISLFLFFFFQLF